LNGFYCFHNVDFIIVQKEGKPLSRALYDIYRRDNERIALHFAENVFTNRLANIILDCSGIELFRIFLVGHVSFDDRFDLFGEFLVIFVGNQPKTADSRMADKFVCPLIDLRDDHDNPLGRQFLAVDDDIVFDLAVGLIVDIGLTGFDRFDLFQIFWRQFDLVTVAHQKDVALVDTALYRRFGVAGDMVVFAVNRKEEFRLRQAQHQFLLLLRRVAGDMNFTEILIGDRRACPHQVVHHARHTRFVTRNRLGRDDDRIARLDFDVTVFVRSHTVKRTHRLALTAGRDDQHLIVAVSHHLMRIDEDIFGNIDITELSGCLEVALHRASDHGDFAVIFDTVFDRLIDAVDVGGEGGHDDTSLRLREKVVECRPDRLFTACNPRLVGVGAV